MHEELVNRLGGLSVPRKSVVRLTDRPAPILRIGDQVLTFDVFWPKHLQEVRSTVYIHGQSI